MGEEDAAWGRDPEILLGVEKPGSIPARNPVKGPPHLGSLLLSLSASLFPRAAQIWVRSSLASPSSWSLGAQGRLLSPPSPPAYPNSEPVSATPSSGTDRPRRERVANSWEDRGVARGPHRHTCFSRASGISGLHELGVHEGHVTAPSLWASLKPTASMCRPPPPPPPRNAARKTAVRGAGSGERGAGSGSGSGGGGRSEGRRGREGPRHLLPPDPVSATTSRGCHFGAWHPPGPPASDRRFSPRVPPSRGRVTSCPLSSGTTDRPC